jgi:hypothetical protein
MEHATRRRLTIPVAVAVCALSLVLAVPAAHAGPATNQAC